MFKRIAGGAACSCGWYGKRTKAKRIPFPYRDNPNIKVKEKWRWKVDQRQISLLKAESLYPEFIMSELDSFK
jgi:hypothetical protein